MSKNKPAGELAKLEVLAGDGKHSEELRKLGAEIVADTIRVAGKYLTLVQYIRKNQVPPKLVSFELAAVGFAKTRISELNRVANAEDKVFNEFVAGTIGLKRVLELTRGNVVNLGQALLSDGSPVETAEAESIIDEATTIAEETEAEAKEPGEPKNPTIAFNKAAMAVLRFASKEKLKKRTWHWEGYKLELSKPKQVKKLATAPAE